MGMQTSTLIQPDSLKWKRVSTYTLTDRFLFQQVSNAPLIIFRLLFGAMMCVSVVRFAANSWINEFYIQPVFHFPYYGMEWVQVLPGWGIYLLFALIFLSSLGICLGLYYRLSTVFFFLSFTYVELIDKTYYLNHYYFVSIIAFWLIWLPAHRRFSLDAKRQPALFSPTTSILHINVLRWQTGLVYCYAGLAKINDDWLLRAMPLRLWLPANGHILGLGFLLKQSWVAYVFSWFGMLYDLTVPFFLSSYKTRRIAYFTVIIFHVLTAILFPIGIFPWVMIFSALIFFPADQQERWLQQMENVFVERSVRTQTSGLSPRKSAKFPKFGRFVPFNLNDHGPLNPSTISNVSSDTKKPPSQAKLLLFSLVLALQLLLPWRHLLYPGSVFWHEEGYRFSWRVMLMEKAGNITFRVTDPDSGHSMYVDNRAYLTPQQEKMMATQPDMILQFARYLDKTFAEKGILNPVVTADAYVTLNGRLSRRFIDPHIDLSAQPMNLKHREWVLSYEE